MNKGPVPDLSESFLHFLDDEQFNKSRQTYCSEINSNAFHDSGYRWCKVCNKIFCTRCSLVHLLNNQITHTPIDKVFLSKEHLDVEFNRDFDKLNELNQDIELFFNNYKKETIQFNYNEILNTYKDFIKELNTILNNFLTKVKAEFEKFEKNSKNFSKINMRENFVRETLSNIYNRFANIEKNYSKCPNFEPTKMKSYYDELSSAYDDFSKLNDMIRSNNNRNIKTGDTNEGFNKIKNKISVAINQMKTCYLGIKNLCEDKKNCDNNNSK